MRWNGGWTSVIVLAVFCVVAIAVAVAGGRVVAVGSGCSGVWVAVGANVGGGTAVGVGGGSEHETTVIAAIMSRAAVMRRAVLIRFSGSVDAAITKRDFRRLAPRLSGSIIIAVLYCTLAERGRRWVPRVHVEEFARVA